MLIGVIFTSYIYGIVSSKLECCLRQIWALKRQNLIMLAQYIEGTWAILFPRFFLNENGLSS